VENKQCKASNWLHGIYEITNACPVECSLCHFLLIPPSIRFQLVPTSWPSFESLLNMFLRPFGLS
jgi:hypothetical protein